jgi:hypothetical protein
VTAPPPPAAAATYRRIREGDAPALAAFGRGLDLDQGDPTGHLSEAARNFYRSLGAEEEPVIACALDFEAFDRLAEIGAALTTGSAGDPCRSRHSARPR